MPSWIMHLITANKIKQNSEKNEFIFGNIMPDILEGYHIKNVSKMIKDYQTHYPEKKIINGITIPLPNIHYFKEEYKDKMQNPVIKGYYCHLLTDYYWNTYTYMNYFKNFDKEKGLVKIKLKGEKEEIIEWDEAVRIKQRDFKNFTNDLKDKEKIVTLFYDDKIRKYSKEIREFEFTSTDIKNTIDFIQKMIQNKNKEKTEEYQIFTEKELQANLDKSIEFIKEKLKE